VHIGVLNVSSPKHSDGSDLQPDNSDRQHFALSLRSVALHDNAGWQAHGPTLHLQDLEERAVDAARQADDVPVARPGILRVLQ
jgi:hypothetical protein